MVGGYIKGRNAQNPQNILSAFLSNTGEMK
jgi:hypothetical protein